MIANSNPSPPRCQGPSQIYGYARASSDSQVISPKMQSEDITKLALTINPRIIEDLRKWLRTYVFIDAGKSADSIPYDQRPEFVKMMNAIQPGDHLIVWRWDRIDRGSTFQAAIEWIKKYGIRLHVLEDGGREQNFDEPSQEFMATIHGGIAKYENAKRRLASMRAKQFLKDHGTYIHGMPMPGTKLIWRGGKRSYQHDEAERVLCREIGSRVYHGTFRGKPAVLGVDAVRLDFTARGEVTANGKPWSRDRIRRVAIWMLGCVDRKIEPWTDCTPYTFESASQFSTLAVPDAPPRPKVIL